MPLPSSTPEAVGQPASPQGGWRPGQTLPGLAQGWPPFLGQIHLQVIPSASAVGGGAETLSSAVTPDLPRPFPPPRPFLPTAGQPLWRVEHLLLVTDEYGTILGFDFLLGGSLGMPVHEALEPRAIALLCYSMFCPLGAGEPRRPKLLTVGDPALHK